VKLKKLKKYKDVFEALENYDSKNLERKQASRYHKLLKKK